MLPEYHTAPSGPTAVFNRLLYKLSDAEYTRIMARCELMVLPLGAVLCEAGTIMDHAYFPVTGVIALVKPLNRHEPLVIEQIGNEGMLGATLLLNLDVAPLRGVVQGAGTALRMTTTQLQASLQDTPALLYLLKHYLYVVMAQLAQAIGCTRFHAVAERLARGLLMAHDRAHSNHFHLTHQFLADMLGVQRGAVTIAAGLLQQKKIIHYTRGEITIVDRQALEQASCECYAAIIQDYSRLFR